MTFIQLEFATRQSALARWQTNWVIDQLKSINPNLICKETILSTRGDRILNKPLPDINGKGLFTQELETELLSGNLQVAVHSLKDLPVEDTPGLTIAAIPKRGEARDVLISPNGYSLKTLPHGSTIGTSSLRRTAQVLLLRPDLNVLPIRGNVDTRLKKVIDKRYDAIILAGAGVQRLGLTGHISQWIPTDVFLPAPGQGALAVQCRIDDAATLSLCQAIEDPNTRANVTAERQFLYHLGGGCAVPVGAFCIQNDTDKIGLKMDGVVASLDGSKVIRVSAIGENPYSLGKLLGSKAKNEGAMEIISGEINGI